MYPVTGLNDVKLCWLEIQGKGYKIYGFLLYTGSDVAIVDYLKEGIYDLDVISGKECAIFLIEPPTSRWMEYTRRRGHGWWQLYGKKLIPRPYRIILQRMYTWIKELLPKWENASISVQGNVNCTIVIGNNNTVTLGQLIAPEISRLYDRNEAYNIARHFNLSIQNVPSLILFKNINSHVIYKSELSGLLNQNDVSRFFRSFFSSEQYKNIRTS